MQQKYRCVKGKKRFWELHTKPGNFKYTGECLFHPNTNVGTLCLISQRLQHQICKAWFHRAGKTVQSRGWRPPRSAVSPPPLCPREAADTRTASEVGWGDFALWIRCLSTGLGVSSKPRCWNWSSGTRHQAVTMVDRTGWDTRAARRHWESPRTGKVLYYPYPV